MKHVHYSPRLCFPCFIFIFEVVGVFFFSHCSSIPGELRCHSFPYSGSLVNQSAFHKCILHLLSAMQGFGEQYRSM